jgi:hypothetical protein
LLRHAPATRLPVCPVPLSPSVLVWRLSPATGNWRKDLRLVLDHPSLLLRVSRGDARASVAKIFPPARKSVLPKCEPFNRLRCIHSDASKIRCRHRLYALCPVTQEQTPASAKSRALECARYPKSDRTQARRHESEPQGGVHTSPDARHCLSRTVISGQRARCNFFDASHPKFSSNEFRSRLTGSALVSTI